MRVERQLLKMADNYAVEHSISKFLSAAQSTDASSQQIELHATTHKL